MAPSHLVNSDTKFHLASPLGLTYLACASLVLLFVHQICLVVYNIFFHPLAKFPGSKLWAASPLVNYFYGIWGTKDSTVRKFHDQYGDVVRVGPNELTFISAPAWQDIYGHNRRQMRKYFKPPVGEHQTIINANDADHTRYRKALAHAFSEKALREQEKLIKGYVDLLVERLHSMAAEGTKANMVNWYNFTTFDLIGDLTFGASFDCLETSTMHPWIRNIFHFVRSVPVFRLKQDFPAIAKMVLWAQGEKRTSARPKQLSDVRDKTIKRIYNKEQEGRYDFTDSMLKHRGDKDEMNDEEIAANANLLILAGSETTATLLSGVTYFLLKNPEKMQKAKEEVRAAFGDENEITFVTATSRLPYMLACLDEAFRMYPPVPTSLPRVTPPGAPSTISGYEVPANTMVGVHQWSAYTSSQNFTTPESYIPERWLSFHSPHVFTKTANDNLTKTTSVSETEKEEEDPWSNDNRAVLQPFSVGPRNCIGRNLAYNEMRMILARVLWNFELELCPESDDWINQKTFLLWDKGEMWCKLHPRVRA